MLLKNKKTLKILSEKNVYKIQIEIEKKESIQYVNLIHDLQSALNACRGIYMLLSSTLFAQEPMWIKMLDQVSDAFNFIEHEMQFNEEIYNKIISLKE